MCRCSDRREAIARSLGAAVRGDVAEVARQAGVVVRSAQADLADLRLAAAHRRLRRAA
jgi:hypothetical protein